MYSPHTLNEILAFADEEKVDGEEDLETEKEEEEDEEKDKEEIADDLGGEKEEGY